MAAGLALGLAGCGGGGGRTDAPIACPNPAIPADAADLTRHEPGAAVRDLTTMVFDARLAGLSGSCRAARRGEAVELTLSPRFAVDRGAAARGRSVVLPWAVAVLDGRTDDPLAPPRRFVDRVVFNPNEARATVTGQSVPILLPVGAERRIQDYRILVYFQLTEEELAMNRRRGPR